MKKKLFNLTTALLFVTALLVNFSTSRTGRLAFVNQSQADPSYHQKPIILVCPNGQESILLCGVGSEFCLPYGQCHPQT